MSSKDIRDVALKYLAHRDHTTFEMAKHLTEKEFTPDEIQAVVLSLLELKYLDDYGYCRKYIPYSANKGKGESRIKTELVQKGVAPVIIDRAMGDAGQDGDVFSLSEFDRAMRQGEKTIGGQEITEKMIGKVGRRLSTLGYTTEVVYKVIGILLKGNRGSEDD